MAVYGGFAPGTYQGWALNLLYDVFGTAGIARGMAVTAPGGMSVTVGVDPVASDGVCYLSNGSFLRIDAAINFSVPNNSSGGTRTDAIVAFCDPTGAAGNPSLTYQTNWATGMSGNSNQFVVALISVANGAANITSGNITMNSSTAKLGNAGGAANSMAASDGVGLSVIDNSATSTLQVVTTGLTTGQGRLIDIVVTDTSEIGHHFSFNMDGSFTPPGRVHAEADSAGNATWATGLWNPDTTGTTPAGFYDNSASKSVVLYPIWSGPGAAQQQRSFVIQAVDNSNAYCNFAVNPDGSVNLPTVGSVRGGINGVNGASASFGNPTNGDVHITTGTGNWVYFDHQGGTSAHIDQNGVYQGAAANANQISGSNVWVQATQPVSGVKKYDLWFKTTF